MYTSEAKKRQTQTMLKSTIISKKSLNSMQKSSNSKPGTVRTTIVEYGIKSRSQSKSKFTIPSPVLTSESYNKRLNPYLPLHSNLSVSTGKGSSTIDSNKRSNLSSISATKTLSYIRGVTNNATASYKKAAYQKFVHLNQNTLKKAQKVPEEFEPELLLPESCDMSTQTNEGEILNHALIVGDLKIMQPSKFVIDEIEKMRKDLETKSLLKATRTFEEHSKRDEQHLEDLQEFLEKSYISRKPCRVSNIPSEEDRILIASMDELLQRKKLKVESVTDIKKRIKQKEQELLSLFNHIQKTTEQFGKTKV